MPKTIKENGRVKLVKTEDEKEIDQHKSDVAAGRGHPNERLARLELLTLMLLDAVDELERQTGVR